MIRQWFDRMNEVLDDLIQHYPHASSEQKMHIYKQWQVLKAMSDDMIEMWLQFEDKMDYLRECHECHANNESDEYQVGQQTNSVCPQNHVYHQTFDECKQTPANIHADEAAMLPYQKGQGYFKLYMYKQSSDQLEIVLAAYPDYVHARLLLAMCRMHLQQWYEAQRHFQFIAACTEETKLQAIAYNALGCIQAVFAHLDQAQRYFRKALAMDSSFRYAQLNLDACQGGLDQLQLQFGSSELQDIALQ